MCTQYAYIFNVGLRLMSWFPIVSFCPDQLSILPFVWGGALLSEVFYQINFFQDELYPPLCTFR